MKTTDLSKYIREPIGNITLQDNGKDWVVYLGGNNGYFTCKNQYDALMMSYAVKTYHKVSKCKHRCCKK